MVQEIFLADLKVKLAFNAVLIVTHRQDRGMTTPIMIFGKIKKLMN